jgi:RimJ/RimL family protein N-acetyltransferase
MLTERLEIRPIVDSDRTSFIKLFSDPEFMVYFGVQSVQEAHRSVDHLLAVNSQVPFAKQPIIVRQSGAIVGYAGVDWFDLGGTREFEFGYRLVPEARGVGYATEAGLALLDLARSVFDGMIYALIDEQNAASISTITKLGFTYWKQDLIDGVLRNLYRWDRNSTPCVPPW